MHSWQPMALRWSFRPIHDTLMGFWPTLGTPMEFLANPWHSDGVSTQLMALQWSFQTFHGTLMEFPANLWHSSGVCVQPAHWNSEALFSGLSLFTSFGVCSVYDKEKSLFCFVFLLSCTFFFFPPFIIILDSYCY